MWRIFSKYRDYQAMILPAVAVLIAPAVAHGQTSQPVDANALVQKIQDEISAPIASGAVVHPQASTHGESCMRDHFRLAGLPRNRKQFSGLCSRRVRPD